MSELKQYAHIENDTVINVVVWDGVSDWQPGFEPIIIEEGSPIWIGWTRQENGEWAPPPFFESSQVPPSPYPEVS